ncbi:hypothetical protein HON52_04755 [Candidatus Uhrbacteria bacterium]|jgi:hypothetical protein|nr:hypothetical protein [Candidatus Uhrbacteria bacterium]
MAKFVDIYIHGILKTVDGEAICSFPTVGRLAKSVMLHLDERRWVEIEIQGNSEEGTFAIIEMEEGLKVVDVTVKRVCCHPSFCRKIHYGGAYRHLEVAVSVSTKTE